MRGLAAVVCCLWTALMVGGWEVQARERTPLTFAVGAAGTDSFVFATELWAVSEIALPSKSRFDLEAIEVPSRDDRLRQLLDDQVDFAFVHGHVPTAFADRVRTVMALWPNGAARASAEPMQLLVRRQVPDQPVYQVTKTIFEQARRLRGAEATMGVGTPSDALLGIGLPIHSGAHRYYQERGVDFVPDFPSMSRRTKPGHELGAVDIEALSYDEILQLLAACRDARARGALRHLDDDPSTAPCSADVVGGVRVELTDHAIGQGGPRISVQEGDEAIRRKGLKRRAGDPVAHRLRPTM